MYIYGFARPGLDVVMFNYPALHYSRPCCSECCYRGSGIAALQEKSLPGLPGRLPGCLSCIYNPSISGDARVGIRDVRV